MELNTSGEPANCAATQGLPSILWIPTVLDQPPYSPDLAPNDFFQFPKIKKVWKGRHYDEIDDIRGNMTAALKVIPQNQFQNCFQGSTKPWHQCIASQEYFEGDHSDIQQ
jgi:hypothetical protein